MNGVQPNVGSRNKSIRALSLPLVSIVVPVRLAAFAVVFCAVCPVAGLSRYWVVTLSDWSWSTMSKLRTVGQFWPVPSLPPEATILPEVPADGTLSLPWRSSWNASLKKLVPLQNDTWPNSEPPWPLTQLPCRRAFAVAPTCVRTVPLNPKSIVTTAFRGRLGTVGATAGVVPWVITSGL